MLPTLARTDRHTCTRDLGLTSFAAATFVAGVVIVAFGAPLQAQIAPIDLSSPHLRPTPELRALVSDAAGGSEAIRALIDRLETLDVTVYIRTVTFIYSDLEGRVALLAGSVGHRYLVIELHAGGRTSRRWPRSATSSFTRSRLRTNRRSSTRARWPPSTSASAGKPATPAGE